MSTQTDSYTTPRWIHTAFFVTVAAFLTAGVLLKLWDELAIALLCSAAILYAIIAKARLITSLAVFSTIGIIYVGLSYGDILPDAWTKLYDREYVLRQSYFVFMLYPLVAGSMILWQHMIMGRIIHGRMLLLLFLLMAVSPALGMFFSPFENLAASYKQYGLQQYFFYGLGNRELVSWLAITYLLIVAYPAAKIISLPLIALALYLSAASMQVALMAPALLIIGFAPARWLRPALITLIICFIGASAYTLSQVTESAGEMEANSILRALYWLEALQGFWDSSVIGVGFGKEATSHDYPLLLGTLPPSSFHEFMVNGIHNSFLSMFFRLGLLGGLAFAWFFFVTCLPSDKSHPNVARHAAIVYFACFMSNFVNVGVESPRMLIGNAFCLGYVLACKAVAEKSFYGCRFAPRLAGNISCATSVAGTSAYAPEGGRPLQRDAL